jgi:hypothetical protein
MIMTFFNFILEHDLFCILISSKVPCSLNSSSVHTSDTEETAATADVQMEMVSIAPGLSETTRKHSTKLLDPGSTKLLNPCSTKTLQNFR